MADALTEERLEYELRGLQGWVYGSGRIVRTFTFGDADGAGAFEAAARNEVAGASAEVETTTDPPEVHVALHSAGDGVTADDIDVAHRLDALHGKT